jgi:molecular chaperone DnaK (HSP70)
MAAARYLVGIDLGTTHTVVAYADTVVREEGAVPDVLGFDVPQLVAPGEIAARPLLPSLRYHAGTGELLASDVQLPWHPPELGADVPPAVLGALARTLGARTPARLVSSAKSWLSHGGVDRTAPILPWSGSSSAAHADDVPKVSPVAASASYLAHVRCAWDARFAAHPLASQEVVLTVPASFDEAARALTLQAARAAGLGTVRLVEEPQAAFYHFLDRHRDDVTQALAGVRLALVVDVGGGTTDLTLIQVELRESGPRLTRVAVGEHLMLGGDNMDLALARRAEQRLASGAGGQSAALPTARFGELIAQCRDAKERMLAPGAPESVRVTVLGGGSRLVASAKSTELTRGEVREVVLDGFFPAVDPTARPARRRGGIVELGLPFAADAGITRHVAQFLASHETVARAALGERAPAEGAMPVPDAILLNGGVFHGQPLSERLFEVLASWRNGSRVTVLENDAPDLAVARGAVAYGLARRGVGLRIGGGSARSYHVVTSGQAGSPRRAVCLLPRGAEEGEELVLRERAFSLRVGEPVRFHLVTSTAEAHSYRAGELLELEPDEPTFAELPPIVAVLEHEGASGKREVPVRLAAALTEVGTLELSCIDEGSGRRWKLEMGLRGDASDEGATRAITQLHPRFADATARVHSFFGKSAQDVATREIKTLRQDLEKTLGARETWTTPLLRELFGALLAGSKRRRRSADHERLWFNLTGYCLRPGFGYPLDDWRTKQLWALFDEGVQFAPEAQVWAEWWTLWRRIAGGLDEDAQTRIVEQLAFYLMPPSPRPRPRPKGPKMLGQDDMVRLAGSLERLPPAKKAEVGGWLVERLTKHDEPKQTWWAVGRLGARVPFYGSAHQVLPRETAMKWLALALRQDWAKVDTAMFAAAQLARASGDRERDLPEQLRLEVALRLEKGGAPAAWPSMVREPTELAEAEERRIFGESLPPGLVLVE